MKSTIIHGLSIDLEDWFHVANLESVISKTNWDKQEFRLEKTLNLLLDLFDQHQVKATFFALGWAVRKQPSLLKQIHSRGHELGCHGPDHRLVYELTPAEFSSGLKNDKAYIEDFTGTAVTGYRAPNFSITRRSTWAIEELINTGFRYDSSIFPFQRERYGVPDAPRSPFKFRIGNAELIELPLSVVKVMGRDIPAAGGGYFRLAPYPIFAQLVRKLEAENRSLIFYLHPWEIDADQPRMSGLSWKHKTMHYLNLDKTYHKLDRLLTRFKFGPLNSIAASCAATANVWSWNA